MRLSTRILSALCIASLVLPSFASAATKTIHLREIGKMIQANTKPLSFEMQLKAAGGDVKGTVTVSGTENGTMKTLNTAAADVTVTLDATVDGSAVHAKAHAIVIDSTLYVRLESFDAEDELAAYESLVADSLNTWFSMPIDPEDYAAANKDIPTQRPTLAGSRFDRKINSFFTITQTGTANNTSYRITLPKEKKRAFLMAMMGATKGYTSRYNSMIRAAVRSTTIDVDMTVDAVRDAFSALAGTVNVSTTLDRKKTSYAFTVKTKALATPPIIAAPAESLPLDDILSGWDMTAK